MAWSLIFFLTGMASVAAACLVPATCLPRLPNDKLLHFFAFGGLTLLAGQMAPDWDELRLWLIGLLLAGWLIEVLQNLVPGRKFCWRDLAANTAGIVVAAVFSRWLLVY